MHRQPSEAGAARTGVRPCDPPPAIERSDTVLVFDLDDTLYAERDYVRSGLSALERQLAALYPDRPVATAFAPLHAGGTRFALAPVLAGLGLPGSMETQLLWLYRSHRPAIELRPGAREWLDAHAAEFRALAVLTDGRGITQRLKLAALGLDDLPAYISEECGGDKPDPMRFESIMGRWPAARYVYLGDNAAKDFIAPRRLGWLAVGLLGDAGNVHPGPDDPPADARHAPHRWIERIEELDEVL